MVRYWTVMPASPPAPSRTHGVDPVQRDHPETPERSSGAARLRRRALELKRREHELLAEFASVLGAVDAGILTVDPSGRVRSQNDVAFGILGARVTDLASAFGPFFGGRLAPDTTKHDATLPDRETTELQLVHRPDRWLEVTRFGRPVGDAVEAVIIQDVTEARRSRGLHDAFLGMLSHELRTPVTSIYVAADLLGSSSVSLSEEERSGLIDDISMESERLLRLVEDLLVLAHFDEGISLITEPSLLQHVVPAAVDRERRRLIGIDIELRIGPDLPVVIGDETSVQQVVRNLVSNAVKYGDGKPIVVELLASDEERGVIVRVLDRGQGMAVHEVEAVFRPFFRSPRTARTSSGAGVGLYVCRRLVEAMGGHMWARPRDGGGSEIGFWLPEYAHDPERLVAEDIGQR
jgi:signal transduction histidine kinase